MKKLVFTEEFCQPENLFPFTLTRQIQDIRIGILTIREKWERIMGLPSFDKFEEDYKDLDRSVRFDQGIGDDVLYLIHGNLVPTDKLVEKVKKLKPGECLSVPGRETFIYCISQSEIVDSNKILVHKAVSFNGEIRELQYPWQIFQMNAEAIRDDFQLLTAGRKSAKISKTNTVIGKAVFLEEGVQMEACVLNAVDGPIYVGKNATIMEGSLLRGPLAIGDGSVVKMGTRVYGATTIGPGCTVGGEIKNAVLFANSNKAHDGYLGDSVIGEWCNLGAGTSNSNLKNNVSDVVIWTPHGPRSAGMKCGVLMGDYSRTAINTAINTGTVIGVCCNVMGNGLTPKYIPSFSWGSDGLERYRFEKAIHDIANWKRLKKQEITENDRMILQHIFDHY